MPVPRSPQTHPTNTSHTERHSTASAIVRDAVIGMSDGLTVPFALAAGLSGAVSASRVVVTAGVAEVVAGSIAMGLGGYLAARSEAEHYASELRREQREVADDPEAELSEVRDILQGYGLTENESDRIAQGLRGRPDAWVDFMMRFELGLNAPDPGRARTSAFTIATAYIVGGVVPLVPYMLEPLAANALLPSVIVTLIALTGFGYVKGRFTGAPAIRSAAQTMLIGGLAAAAAFGIAKLIS